MSEPPSIEPAVEAAETAGSLEEQADGAAGGDDGPEAVPSREVYATKEYWDARFRKQTSPFDWYATWEELGPVLARAGLAPTADVRVLMIGCGNSRLSEEMFDAGYSDLTNIDISGVVIAQMRERCAPSRGGMRWLEMDAAATSFETGAFDLALDKGTVDALMCDAETKGPAHAVVQEAARILRVGGHFVLVSHNPGRAPLATCPPPPAATSGGGGGADPPWRLELLARERCELSSSATMINIMRAHLHGRPMAEAMKDRELLLVALKEYKQVLENRQWARRIEAFVRAKKAKQLAAQGEQDAAAAGDGQAAPADRGGDTDSPRRGAEAGTEEAPRDQAEEEEEPLHEAQNLRQQWCWVYIFEKRAEA